MESYRVDVPDHQIDDLQRRLRSARWPDQIPNSAWSYGTDTAYLRELCEYWADGFDWRAVEEAYNRREQVITTIDGQTVHTIHARSRHPQARPLLLIHGWPSTPVEFTKVIDRLTDPVAHGGRAEDAFHVVAPSIPGFGWSGPTTEAGWHAGRVAQAFVTLMERLGYPTYGIHGTDWGTVIGTIMARTAPDRLTGLHLTLITSALGPLNQPLHRPATDEENALKARHDAFMATELGYIAIQSTKPQTLAPGLSDSPIGQASWIVEKLHAWTDSHGDLESALSRDDILESISTFWFSNTAGSSGRIYCESARAISAPVLDRVMVPTGVAVFPAELFLTTRELTDEHYDVQRWTEMPRGGHFGAWEQPELLVEDVRAFFADR